MKKILFHLIVLFGAISNAIVMTTMTKNTWIVMLTTAVYVILFEGLYIFLQPRLIMAERKRNLRKYPLLKPLIDHKRSIITLKNGEKLYNVSYVGYSNPKSTNEIEVALTKQKQAKVAASTESKLVYLSDIIDVKGMK